MSDTLAQLQKSHYVFGPASKLVVNGLGIGSRLGRQPPLGSAVPRKDLGHDLQDEVAEPLADAVHARQDPLGAEFPGRKLGRVVQI